MIEPSARTTVRFTTQSFIVPYLTAFVPLMLVSIADESEKETSAYLQFVATMPPISACWMSDMANGAGRQTYRRTGIHWKPEPAVLDTVVQVDPIDSRLDNDIHTGFISPELCLE
jgi:hypothetical protein